MESDKDMGLIKQNIHIEVPNDWNDHIRASRLKPRPFTVVEAEQNNIFYKWGLYLALQYRKKSPFVTHPITEVFIGKENSRHHCYERISIQRSPGVICHS